MPVGKNYKVGTAPLTQPPGAGLGTPRNRKIKLDELRQMRILVVEENPEGSVPINLMLAKSGFVNTACAQDIEQAVEMLRNSLSFDAYNIELILIDVTTPSFDGDSLCRLIHEHETWCEIPVIMIRSRTVWQDELLSASFDSGATDIVFRPIQRVELIPRVISALLLKRERDLRRSHENELEAELAERRVMEARLQYLVSHDDLTGLCNRRRLEQALETVIVEAKTTGKTSALLYIDLDQFKIINDLEGHVVGDRLLMSIANILRQHLRSHDLLARVSSDEYTILIPECDESRALAIAEHLRNAIDEYHFRTEGRHYHICASVGVSLIRPGEAITVSETLARAAQACYEAKTHGRNMVHLFNQHDTETNILRDAADWVPKIREALHRDNFVMLFQPVIDLDTTDIVGYEALIRMVDGDGSLITPDNFIPIAERMGLIHEIDLWVVEHVIDVLHGLPDDLAHLTINVNLSIHAFQDPALLPLVREKLRTTGIEAKRITFEITETAAVANYEQTRNMVSQLRELGCCFALDDFGTGFSSFNYLKQFPVDYLKIDGSFICNLVNDPVDQRLVKSMIEVGRTLEKKIVAEFVENAEILALLREYGVNHVQGNFIGEPGRQLSHFRLP